jgi:hypothetical protein
MPKEHVKQSLERDAYLCRNEDKETSLKRLQTSVERLSKAMSLSQTDKTELLSYTEQLLEHHGENRDAHDNGESRHRRNSVLNEKTPSTNNDGAGAFD